MKRYFILIILLSLLSIFAYETQYDTMYDAVNVTASGSVLEGYIDINKADLDELLLLPIDYELIYSIWRYREFHSYFDSFYDIMKVPGMTVDTLLAIKEFIYVEKFKSTDHTTARLESFQYLLARQSDEEGLREGVIDEWTDMLLSPFNINKANYTQILNMPNVSSVDAFSIMLKLKDTGEISSVRSLRDTKGLSSYGYRNLRNYVSYSDIEYDKRMHFYAQFYYEDSPLLEDEQEAFDALVRKYRNAGADFLTNYFNTRGAAMTKLRLRKMINEKGWEVKVGGLIFKNYGDDFPIYDKNKLFVELKINDRNRLILGDYRLSFGHGLVMENSDFYSPRKTGFGFSKRIIGLIGDSSRTDVFRMRGVSLESGLGMLSSILFYSSDNKDAVLNDDGTVQSFIVNKPALSNENLAALNDIIFQTDGLVDAINSARDVLKEDTFGGHLRLEPFPGNYIAFTAYHSIYDKFFRPLSRDEFIDNIHPDEYAKYEEKIADNINNEYFFLYNNFGQDKSTRSVLGGEISLNFHNVSLLAEYGKMLKEGQFKKGSEAYVISLYTQYNSLYLLALYRDIDVDYDNPYARPFAENKRFNDTFFEKANYMLLNPLNADLYFQSPWSQPERGLYLETRYQFTRNLTLNRAYIDLWERKADGRPSIRFQGELEYRPVFPFRINYKHKVLHNKIDNSDARSVSITNESTIRLRANLSNFDSISFEYFYSFTKLPPYPYLSNNAEDGVDDLIVGSQKMHGSAYTFSFIKNFTPSFNIRTDLTIWDSPTSSLWDWEDTGIDFMSGSGYKAWILLTNWLSSNINLKVKFWYKRYSENEHFVRKWWNEVIDPNPTNEQYQYLSSVKNIQSAVRFYLTVLY